MADVLCGDVDRLYTYDTLLAPADGDDASSSREEADADGADGLVRALVFVGAGMVVGVVLSRCRLCRRQ